MPPSEGAAEVNLTFKEYPFRFPILTFTLILSETVIVLGTSNDT